MEDAGDDLVGQIVQSYGVQKMAETDKEDDIIEPGYDRSVGDIIQALRGATRSRERTKAQETSSF